MTNASKIGRYGPKDTASKTRLYNQMLRRPSTRKSVILSDVDGTIVRGSLVLQHATMLHDREMIDLGDLPGKWAADRKNEELITELAIAYQKSITGMRIEDLGVDEFVDTICSDSNSFYSALNRLITLKKLGADVHLVSGSPDFLVKSFGDRFGFNAAASRYHVSDSGHLTGQIDGMFSAPAKRHFVSTLDLSGYNEVFAFGDTSSDVPLFEASSYSVLVAPNQVTRETIGATVTEIVEN